MVVPDFELICEIMLVAEGFLEARLLARKFITLYTLCKELLAKPPSLGPGTSGGTLMPTRPPTRRITMTGACEPSSLCWWWPAP